MIADDDVIIRMLLLQYFVESGFEAWVAHNGREALELFELHNGAISVVLLDVQMPEMGGIQTAATIHELDPEVPCCLMTAGPIPVDTPNLAKRRCASLAEQMEARSLLFPTLNAGVNFNLHRGNLESSSGVIRDVDRQALFVGAGARAVGAGTVTIPGVWFTAHLADAVFEPLAAQQQVIGSRFNALATQNAVLLDVATQYLALVGAEARLQAIRQSKQDLAEIVRLTTNFARTGQGREGDASRGAK